MKVLMNAPRFGRIYEVAGTPDEVKDVSTLLRQKAADQKKEIAIYLAHTQTFVATQEDVKFGKPAEDAKERMEKFLPVLEAFKKSQQAERARLLQEKRMELAKKHLPPASMTEWLQPEKFADAAQAFADAFGKFQAETDQRLARELEEYHEKNNPMRELERFFKRFSIQKNRARATEGETLQAADVQRWLKVGKFDIDNGKPIFNMMDRVLNGFRKLK